MLRGRGGLIGRGEPAPRHAAGGSPALLALHGFGATPREVDLIVDQASALGLAASAPLLPGHGTSSVDLARTTFSDWLGAARQALRRLPDGPAVAAGFSLGSLLACELALSEPRIVGLVLLGNAFWLASPYPAWILEWVDRSGCPDFFVSKRHGPDIADPEARRTQLTYDNQPAHAGVEVLRAGERLREKLSEIRCPTLILHGASDHVCPAPNAWRVALRLGTDDVRVRIFPRSNHIITRDYDRAEVAFEIRSFLARLRKESGALSARGVEPRPDAPYSLGAPVADPSGRAGSPSPVDP